MKAIFFHNNKINIMPERCYPKEQSAEHLPVTNGPSEMHNSNGTHRGTTAGYNGRRRGRGCRRGRARERRGVPRANPKVIRNFANQKRRRRMSVADTRTTVQRFYAYQGAFRNFRTQETRKQRSEHISELRYVLSTKYGIYPEDIFYLTSSDCKTLKIRQKIQNQLNFYAEDTPFEAAKALRQFTGLTGIQLKTTGRFLSALSHLVQRDMLSVNSADEDLAMVDARFEQMIYEVDGMYNDAVELLGKVSEMEVENVSEQEYKEQEKEVEELTKSDCDVVESNNNNTGSVLSLTAVGMGVVILGFLWKYR